MEPNPAQASFNTLDSLTGMTADEHVRTYSASFDATLAGSPPQTVNGGSIQLDEFFRTEDDAHLEDKTIKYDRSGLYKGEEPLTMIKTFHPMGIDPF